MPRSPGQGSLFERLTPDLPQRRSRTQQGLATERVRAIKNHLEQLLNTRRGGSQSSPELGLPDMNDAASGQLELRNQICQEIREVVALYEPRVQVLDVRALTTSEQPLGLCFRLHCQVPIKDASEQMEIDLLVHQRQQRIQVM
ncbi:TPA: type VI secretion system baseplate subunit TssE [Pseudomonas aeruginosa]|nr:type VI secretion system baseplate subunit TssE [Pseudomonas aeruginosa]HBO4313770.1 type VI secretion system baseplate subunit TssE [Pseudomonas aeruginosa]HBO4704083.1 type VI secretion system baseplate subunit TssE [Pseudomonas aeruginosa]HCF4400126.1 type VI secretion system baseplate subunit TssE [Pseudomonas aeruginosa]HCF6229148.1 type VI secretion system baseplate subunit TssE [Pseudomonas aeruginosa]